MAGVNKVIIVGHLGRDPEVRSTQSGQKIVSMAVATSESWTDKQTGERREMTEWHRIVVMNDSLADVAEKYLKKGSKVYLEGKLQTRKWTDQSGQERYTTEIILGRFNAALQLLDRNERSDSGRAEQHPAGSTAPPRQASSPPAQTSDWGPGADLDDEIPF